MFGAGKTNFSEAYRHMQTQDNLVALGHGTLKVNPHWGLCVCWDMAGGHRHLTVFPSAPTKYHSGRSCCISNNELHRSIVER